MLELISNLNNFIQIGIDNQFKINGITKIIIKSKEGQLIEHIGYFFKITDSLWSICNITSQSHIKTIDGNINNIKLNNSLFKYVTPQVIVNVFQVEQFLILDKNYNNFPNFIKNYNKDLIIEEIEKAVITSLEYSYNNYHSFYFMETEFKNFKMMNLSYGLDFIVEQNSICIKDKK